jgi:4-diphosphocytidyl-2-C-methyl-D-erythritol kinase
MSIFESSPLLVSSFAKINLALAVLGKRSDGYHELRTVFQTIDLHDELEFHPSATLSLECSGMPDLPMEENLVWKAADRLRLAAGVDRGCRIVLRKRIPTGAGLGGGSSNAAAALLGLEKFWSLALPAGRLTGLAAGLGADVPFFLEGGTALGIGRGDEIYRLPSFPSVDLALVYPGVHVSTAEAYRSLKLRLTATESAIKIQGFCGRLHLGHECLPMIFNDFETSVLPAHPAIREAKELLGGLGASAAMMSGSGSSVFGFFSNEESALAAVAGLRRPDWQVFPAKTLSHAEYHQRLFGQPETL